MKPILHRVDSKKAPKAPPVLPKEAVQTGPKEYVDRWGVLYLVVWGGEKWDPDLRDLSTNVLK